MQQFSSNCINYSVTPATSVTSVFFFCATLGEQELKNATIQQQ
ncbi:hypothetical protein B6N60_02393 [Richelia sinica FACHB-800]|uniref:Uncharacterized protein n=1 Tax=Richelia sinica FACHB-800 TaxID=1357546 RepID=A0A975T7M6_9NOST|nr:hypothetical protein [Richelia sinica]QXE23703.1 hypothetical protein B6N60_02393 [Richelia sinica FACHB-800]